MKNKLLPTILIAGFAVFFLSVILLNANNLNTYNSSAQTPIIGYPTPVLNQSKYLYATYTCNNDPTRSSYVLMNSGRCKGAGEWKQQASNSCYSKGLSLASYKLSPECATNTSTITVWPTRVTPTPACIPAPACLYTEPRCLMPEPIGGWCKLTPTPAVSIYPTRYTTCNPTAGVISCPQPPPNCKYVGGDGCTTCGKLYCITPGYGSPYPTGGFTPYPTKPVFTIYPTIYPLPTGSR